LNIPEYKWEKCLIIGHGDDVPIDPPPVDENTLIIAADGGLFRAREWGLTPHWIVGDFDSVDFEAGCEVPQERVIVHPVEKDKTDLELAVDYALGLGAAEIVMTGVWGGRPDHSLGNIELLYKLANLQIKAWMITSGAHLHLAGRELQLKLPVGTTVSLLPLSEVVKGVTTSGLYYPLHNAVIRKGSTRTISNKTMTACVEIRCEEGVLLVVVITKDPR